MDVDLGLLLATVATAAAALVAIVGGLLVSRVVSLATERSGLLHRRDDLLGQLETELNRHYDLQHRLLASDAGYILRPKYKQLADPEARVDLEAWIAEAEIDRRVKEVEPFLRQEQERFAEAREKLLPGFEAHDGVPNFDFDDLVMGGVFKLPPGYRDIYSAVFDQLAKEFEPPRRHGVGSTSTGRTSATKWNHWTSRWPTTSSTHLERSVDETQHRIAALEVQVEQARTALSRVSRPVGVGTGVAVLGYFGTVGTLVPLAMMMFEPRLQTGTGWLEDVPVVVELG